MMEALEQHGYTFVEEMVSQFSGLPAPAQPMIKAFADDGKKAVVLVACESIEDCAPCAPSSSSGVLSPQRVFSYGSEGQYAVFECSHSFRPLVQLVHHQSTRMKQLTTLKVLDNNCLQSLKQNLAQIVLDHRRSVSSSSSPAGRLSIRPEHILFMMTPSGMQFRLLNVPHSEEVCEDVFAIGQVLLTAALAHQLPPQQHCDSEDALLDSLSQQQQSHWYGYLRKDLRDAMLACLRSHPSLRISLADLALPPSTTPPLSPYTPIKASPISLALPTPPPLISPMSAMSAGSSNEDEESYLDDDSSYCNSIILSLPAHLQSASPDETNMLYYQATVLMNTHARDQLMALAAPSARTTNFLAIAFVMRIYASGLAQIVRNLGLAQQYCQRAWPFMLTQMQQPAAAGGGSDVLKYIYFLFSTCCAHGLGGEQVSHAQVLRYCQLSAALGYSSAFNYLAYCHKTGEHCTQDLSEAHRYYRLAADAGHAGAQVQLGNWYEAGKPELSLIRDLPKAVQFYEKAAAQGHYIAMNNLGNLYYVGKGPVPRDLAIAALFYKQAVRIGRYHIACNNLASCYYYGEGVRKNLRYAAKYYKQAATQYPFYAPAQYNLAVCLEYGEGLDKDIAQSMHYYTLSARQGFAEAQYSLGKHHERGTNGLAKDLLLAVNYYQLAADQGHFDARLAVERLLRKN